MTDEERQRTMDFIVAQQAQFWSNMQKLEDSQQRAAARMDRSEARMDRSDARMERGNLRIDRLERVLKLMIKAGQRARKRMREQNEEWERRFGEVREMVAAIGQAQAHSDRKFDSLMDLVREQRHGQA
jgi:hypothetical protein